MQDPDSRKWIIASAFVCIFSLLICDGLSKVYPAYWSNSAKYLLSAAVKECFVSRARGLGIKPSHIGDFHQVLFMNRPGVTGDCSFVVKAVDYPWWHPARFNNKRWRPQSETWFAIEASHDGDVPFKEICGDASKPGCKDGGQWQPVVDNRD